MFYIYKNGDRVTLTDTDNGKLDCVKCSIVGIQKENPTRMRWIAKLDTPPEPVTLYMKLYDESTALD